VPVRCKHELQKKFSQIVAIWNSLPNSVVSAESVDSFKTRLDKYWMICDFMTTEPTHLLPEGIQKFV